MQEFLGEDICGIYIRDYLIRGHIGRNRISERYVAQNTLNQERAVVVFLRPTVQQEPELSQRFEQQMNKLGTLSHPSLPNLIYAKVPPDNHAFALFKYIPGELLANMMQIWQRERKPMPILAALTLVRKIASALSLAHDIGLIHYNLNPRHILLTADNTPILLNLGLPFVLWSPDETPEATYRQKLDYRAPEQRAGAAPTAANNIFSLGLILHELLTGKRLALPLVADDELEQRTFLQQIVPEQLGVNLAEETHQALRDCLDQSSPTHITSASALVHALDLAIAAEQERIPALQSALPHIKRFWWLFLVLPVLLLVFFLFSNQLNVASNLSPNPPTRTAVSTTMSSPTTIPISLLQPTTPALPTLAPVAALPTEIPPTATSVLPPTIDLTAIVPTNVPTIAPTRRPTLTPTPVEALLNITEPKKDDNLLMGSTVEARGLIQIDEGQTIGVDLISANGRLLRSVPGTVGDVGWEASFAVPEFVSGSAVLQASIYNEAHEIMAQNRVPVNLLPDIENADRYLLLLRPQVEEQAVGGFNLFFDGRVLRPTNSLITISIWTEGCQTQVSKQSFTLGQSVRDIYWQGFTVPPHDTAGAACAVAHIGEPGEEDWREAVVPITIYAADEAEAKGVTIGNPPAEAILTAGNELSLYGTALNVSEGPVHVNIVMESGFILFDSGIPTDFWGYWQESILIPPDVFGAAEISVFTESDDPDAYAETKTTIVIEPAPTPTP